MNTIWNALDDIDIDDIREDYPELTDHELMVVANDIHEDQLNDEKVNLNIDVNGIIVCFADIGRWNGRVSGFKELGSNISNILQPMVKSHSFCHWYLNDEDDICCDESHHDATNHYKYRLVTQDDLNEADYQDKPYEWLLKRSASIAPQVKEVYGW